MTTPTQEVNELFARLQPQALLEYQKYILSRTRHDLHALMVPLATGDPSPPTSSQAVINNGDTIPVQNSAGAAIGSATATVSGGALTSARLPATIAGVANGGTAPVQNSAGAAIGTGTIAVAAGVVSSVRTPATVAGVSNGGAVVVHNLADANQAGSPGTATVAAGVLTKVNLTV